MIVKNSAMKITCYMGLGHDFFLDFSNCQNMDTPKYGTKQDQSDPFLKVLEYRGPIQD